MARAEASATVADHSLEEAHSTLDVLIIDDNQTNVLLLKHLVAKVDGCRPVTFTDPVEALGWCSSNAADLVVVDYMMPELDGLEFVARFRALPRNGQVPIVMVTTADLKEVRYEALKRGATDFLTKPVDTTELTARVTNLITLRRAQRQLEDHTAVLSREVEKATASIVARENEVIFRLSRAAEYRDPETGQHITRMAHYSRLIAIGLGLSDEQLDLIFRAAPMHDIGKVGIADEILLKPGRLTPEEFEIMKEHTLIGEAILKDSPSLLLQRASIIAAAHHEKFDGSGYPYGLQGEEIPLEGRIVAVADVFDALTSERPYKKPWPVQEARDLIERERGKHFDPQCVDSFFDMYDAVLRIRDRYHD